MCMYANGFYLKEIKTDHSLLPERTEKLKV